MQFDNFISDYYSMYLHKSIISGPVSGRTVWLSGVHDLLQVVRFRSHELLQGSSAADHIHQHVHVRKTRRRSLHWPIHCPVHSAGHRSGVCAVDVAVQAYRHVHSAQKPSSCKLEMSMFIH